MSVGRRIIANFRAYTELMSGMERQLVWNDSFQRVPYRNLFAAPATRFQVHNVVFQSIVFFTIAGEAILGIQRHLTTATQQQQCHYSNATTVTQQR